MELTHYEVLGVPQSANLTAIRAAYRRRARDTHPDTGGDAAEFARVARAWETLSSDELRDAYDAELAGISDGDWGQSVGFGVPAPGPRPAPERRADDHPGPAGSAEPTDTSPDAPPPPGEAPINPFASPPRALPTVDDLTRHLRGSWAPRPVHYLVTTVAVFAVASGLAATAARASRALTGDFVALAVVTVLFGGLSIVRLAGIYRSIRPVIVPRWTQWILLAYYVLQSAGTVDHGPTEAIPGPDPAGDAMIGSAIALGIGLAFVTDRLVTRRRRWLERRVVVSQDMALAGAWNDVLGALERRPDGRFIMRDIRLTDGTTTLGWVLVDGAGHTIAAAHGAAPDVWAAMLRSAGLAVLDPRDRGRRAG